MSESHEDRIVYLPCPSPEAALRLHLDENVARAVAVALRTRGFDVTTTHDAGLRSKSDDSQMAFAHEAQRVLITRDKGFLQLCRESHPHSGVVYWPHGRSTKSSDMQKLLIELLQQIARSPAEAAEMVPPGKRARSARRRKKRKAAAAARAPAVSRNLPAGYLVCGQVESVGPHEIQVRLTQGQLATLQRSRAASAPLATGAEIAAVTVQYVRSRKVLHVSMRRNFALARTMIPAGLRALRRSDYQWKTRLETERPVEIVFEEPCTVRVFGETGDAVRETANELDREAPWSASAVLRSELTALKKWVESAFGRWKTLADSTGTMISLRSDGLIQVGAATNRELDHVIQLLQIHVPGTEVMQLQAARFEPLHACAWPLLDEV